jgi:hypothetical protein
MDYETKAHTFFLGMNLMPVKKVEIVGNFSYTLGEGSIEDFHFDSIYPTGDVKLDYNVSILNPNMPYLYDTAYLNGFAEYSNLEFSEIDLMLGVNYSLTNRVGVGLHYYYNDLNDEETYVYGDQSISLQSLMGIMSFKF